MLGDDPESVGSRLAYVGQSDNVGNRLAQHDARKAFWTEVVIVTSKDENLTSAHARYLESRLFRLAKSIGRVPLANGNEPTGGADLSESDAAYMDTFVDELRIVLPVLGVDLFRGRESSGARTGIDPVASRRSSWQAGVADQTSTSPIFKLQLKRLGVDARAQVIDGEFTVLAGSTISAHMRPSSGKSQGNARNFTGRSVVHARVMTEATIVPPGTLATLVRDVVFTSPSAAAAVVQGKATANGRSDWATDAGLRYADWENRDVE